MRTNKTLVKALSLCGYVDVDTAYTEKKLESGKVVGHTIHFFARRNGTSGTLAKMFHGIAELKDVANSNPTFNICIDLEMSSKGHNLLTNPICYKGSIKQGLY